MKRMRRQKVRRKPPDSGLEVAFEAEVRRSPVEARAELLTWLRTWRRRPDRVFWVVGELGDWRRV